jgi:hypothetical protein
MLEGSSLLPLDKETCHRIERDEFWSEHDKHICDEFGNENVSLDDSKSSDPLTDAYNKALNILAESNDEEKPPKRKTSLDVNFSMKPAGTAMETFGKGR